MSGYDAAFKAAAGEKAAEASPYDEAFKLAASPNRAPDVTPARAEKVADFSGTLRLGPIDTRIPLPQSVNKGLAQFGSGMADLVQGVKQRSGYADESDTAFKRQADESLNDGYLGKGLNLLGKAAPLLAVPTVAAAPVLSGVGIGALSGFLEPTAKGDSVAFNTGMGGLFGGAIPAIGKLFSRAATGAAPDPLAKAAIEKYDIPLDVASISDSKTLKAVRSVLNDLPVTGSIGAAQNQAKQEGFNRAVSKTFGEDAKQVTPQVMQAAKSRIGGEFDRIWKNNDLVIDPQYITDLNRIAQRAGSLNPEQQAILNKQVQNLLSQANGAKVPGSFTNNWQSELRMTADGEKGLMKDVLADLRRSTLGAFNRNVSAADAKALSTANVQYKALKTISPLMNKAEAGVAGRSTGDVPAALLPGSVVQQYGDYLSTSPFKDLAPIAGRFMVDRTPQTGGSVRALMQNAGVGAGVASAGAYVNPLATGAALAVGAGGQAALGPGMARRMVQDKVSRGLLGNPNAALTIQELLQNSMTRAPIPLGAGLLSLPALE